MTKIRQIINEYIEVEYWATLHALYSCYKSYWYPKYIIWKLENNK